jgi:hypothetical protein
LIRRHTANNLKLQNIAMLLEPTVCEEKSGRCAEGDKDNEDQLGTQGGTHRKDGKSILI